MPQFEPNIGKSFANIFEKMGGSYTARDNTVCPGNSVPFYMLYVQEEVTHFI